MPVADAAEPFSQPSHDAKMTVKMTPETYSGVAVVAIEATDSVRSVREPSRMPARMPTSSAIGTIVTITQNIRMPVAPSAGNSFDATVVLNLVEQPKSPCRMPREVGSAGSLQKREARRRLAGRGIDDRLLRHDAEPLAVADEEVLAVAVA